MASALLADSPRTCQERDSAATLRVQGPDYDVRIVVASLSLACLLALFYISRKKNRFPTSMLLHKAAADSLVCIIIIATNSALALAQSHDRTREQLIKNGIQLCQKTGALFPFLMGAAVAMAIFWCAALAYNLNRSIHDPFTRPTSRMLKFHGFAWTFAIIFGVVAAIDSPSYNISLDMCWSCDLHSFTLFLVPISLYLFSSSIFLIDAYLRLSAKRHERLAMRMVHVKVSAIYVFSFGFQWTLTCIAYGLKMSMILEDDRRHILFAIAIGLLGPVDLFAFRIGEFVSRAVPGVQHVEEKVRNARRWEGASRRADLASKKRELRALSREGEKADISHWLRQEFVFETIEGLRSSVRRLSLSSKEGKRSITKGHRKSIDQQLQLRHSTARKSMNGIEMSEIPEMAVEHREGQRDSFLLSASSDGTSKSLRDRKSPEPQIDGSTFFSSWLPSPFHCLFQSKPIFDEYMPHTFDRIRHEIFHTDMRAYLESFIGHPAKDTQTLVSQMVLSFSEGKGGGFFFWSLDQRFLVKTLEQGEFDALAKLLHEEGGDYSPYEAHLRESAETSLLPRFYGCYAITIQYHTKRFVVMESVFSTIKLPIHNVFDLKGSWIDRHSDLPDASSGTYKDMDLHSPLRLDKSSSRIIYRNLESDSKLLCDHNIMDYSLLLGVHNFEQNTGPGTHDAVSEKGGNAFVAQTIYVPIYAMGLIDILQTWNSMKWMERYSKIIFKARFSKYLRDGMSAVEPVYYRHRFLRAMRYQLGLEESESSFA